MSALLLSTLAATPKLRQKEIDGADLLRHQEVFVHVSGYACLEE